jgi:hypothetical protein
MMQSSGAKRAARMRTDVFSARHAHRVGAKRRPMTGSGGHPVTRVVRCELTMRAAGTGSPGQSRAMTVEQVAV